MLYIYIYIYIYICSKVFESASKFIKYFNYYKLLYCASYE